MNTQFFFNYLLLHLEIRKVKEETEGNQIAGVGLSLNLMVGLPSPKIQHV